LPNLTFYIQAEKMPPAQALAALTQRCSQLCVEVLDAALENVHIIYVPVRRGRGHPAFAEIKYRLQPSRTAPVMALFMEALDEAMRRHAALTVRVRCFGYTASTIHARN